MRANIDEIIQMVNERIAELERVCPEDRLLKEAISGPDLGSINPSEKDRIIKERRLNFFLREINQPEFSHEEHQYIRDKKLG